jgi:uncharacterized protein YegL
VPAEPASQAPLVFRVPVLGEDPTEFTYRTRLTLQGSYPPVASARVEYFDSNQDAREARLDDLPAVEVLPPPDALYFPMVAARTCVRRIGGVDAVLAVDTSDSMTGQKLEEAIGASAQFVRKLDARRDRIAVVAYSEYATVAQPMTSNFGAVDSALVSLATSPGTRIDRGLEAATAEVLRLSRPGVQPVIVLLSDGRQDVERSRAVTAGSIAAESGVLVYTVALGDDADLELLAAVASDPSRALVARDPAGLGSLFAMLAAMVRCL